MPRFLNAIPDPLLEDLVHGRWLPLVGAGFSRNAEYSSGPPPADWHGLGMALGAAMRDADADAPPIETISAFEQAFGRVALVDKVGELVRVHDARPGVAHMAFARVAFRNVVTTNFDFLLERAYERVGRGCLPVVDEGQLSSPNRSVGPRVLKMHGDLHHPERLVLTEDDYDQFLHKNPLLTTSISAMFIEHTGVLIGYSLDDADTRQLLALLRLRLGALRRPLWTILFDAKQTVVNRFERRGVKVVNLRLPRGQKIGDAYAQLFDELAAHWLAALPTNSESADDRVSADLRLPARDGRLCFFAVPTRLIGWYRENLFPVVDQAGFVPLTARDVYSPPGSVGAKVDALIGRSAIVVAEVGAERDGEYEAHLAIAQKGRARTLIIAADDPDDRELLHRDNRFALPEEQVLFRPDLDGDPRPFVERFARWLASIPVTGRDSTDEPRRLLSAGEYGPALISAVSLLEVVLTRKLKIMSEGQSRVPLRRLLSLARATNLIESDEELAAVEQAVNRRNEVVHRVRPVAAKNARTDVELLLRIMHRAEAW